VFKISFRNFRVHCWGGLGSQLYALSLVKDLQSKFPNHSISLFLHTGGFSRRVNELGFVKDSSLNIHIVDDFKIRETNSSERPNRIYRLIKSFIRKIFTFFRLLASANNDAEFGRITTLTYSIRGHYFYRTISKDFYLYLLNQLNNILPEKIEVKNRNFKLAIHYRLGDLLELNDKSTLSETKLVDQIKLVMKDQDKIEIFVFSDSPVEAKQRLTNAGLSKEFTIIHCSTIELIKFCIEADFFIGTNSKVSLWIVNLRRFLGRSTENFLEGFQDLLYLPDQDDLSK
jgi:hypothetical protein